MSETTNETTGPVPNILAGLANLTVTGETYQDRETNETRPTGRYDVRWGEGPNKRYIQVKPLTLGDQLDFLETMPAGASEQWQTLAMAAASVRQIEEIPYVQVFKVSHYKATLNKLGDDGLKATLLVINGYRGGGQVPAGAAVDVEAAAKN